jgi:hypothetical protein
MDKEIEIPIELYERLSFYAKGFDTPANVIERMLNFYEEQKGVESTVESVAVSKAPTSLDIIYYPSDENSFKQLFIKTKKAYVLLHKVDGSSELKVWSGSNFDSSSSVNGNLRSGYLRGWKKKGIYKAEISTDENDVI